MSWQPWFGAFWGQWLVSTLFFIDQVPLEVGLGPICFFVCFALLEVLTVNWRARIFLERRERRVLLESDAEIVWEKQDMHTIGCGSTVEMNPAFGPERVQSSKGDQAPITKSSVQRARALLELPTQQKIYTCEI